MKISLDKPIYDAIFNLAKSHKIEWTAYAQAGRTGRNRYRVNDIILPYQENSSGTTEIPTDVSEPGKDNFDATLEWRTRDRDLKKPETWRGPEFNVWIHSHNTMSAFWSATDWEEINNMMKERSEPFACIVVNAKMEYEAIIGIPDLDIIFDAEIDCFEPTISDILTIEPKERKRIFAEWEESVKNTSDLEKKLTDTYELTRPKVITPPSSYGYNKGRSCGFTSSQDTWWRDQADFIEELKKDEKAEWASEYNLSIAPAYEEDWYECDLDGCLIEVSDFPFKEYDDIKARGNIIMRLDENLKPVGVYRGYPSNPKKIKNNYDELFPTIIDPADGLPFPEGLAE